MWRPGQSAYFPDPGGVHAPPPAAATASHYDDSSHSPSSFPSSNFPAIRSVLWERPLPSCPNVAVPWRSYIPALSFTEAAITALATSAMVARPSARPTLGLVPTTTVRLVADTVAPTGTGSDEPYTFALRPAALARGGFGAVAFDARVVGPSSSPSPSSVGGGGEEEADAAASPASFNPATNVATQLSLSVECAGVRTAEDYRAGTSVSSLHLALRIASPAALLRFRYLAPAPRFADTPLAIALCMTGLRNSASPIPGVQCGPLTLDAFRCAVPLLPSDPACRTTPVVGMWVRAAAIPDADRREEPFSRAMAAPAWARTAIRHPAIRAALTWFDECADLGERVHPPGSPRTALLCLLPPLLGDDGRNGFSMGDTSAFASASASASSAGACGGLSPVFFEADVEWPRSSSSSTGAAGDAGVLAGGALAGDGWAVMTVLLRAQLHSPSLGLFELVSASSDVGRAVAVDGGSVRWSLRPPTTLPGSLTALVSAAESKTVYLNGGVGGGPSALAAVAFGAPASTTIRLGNAAGGSSLRDFSSSRLPVPASSAASSSAASNQLRRTWQTGGEDAAKVVEEEEEEGGEEEDDDLLDADGDRTPEEDAGRRGPQQAASASTSASLRSPSRIPLPTFKVPSPRAHRSEGQSQREGGPVPAGAGGSAVAAESAGSGRDDAPLAEGAADANDDATSSASSSSGARSAGLQSPAAAPGPADLSAFKLSPEDHGKLRGISRDLSRLSTMLSGHLHSGPEAEGGSHPAPAPLFSESLRQRERNAVAAAEAQKAAAKAQLEHISATIQGMMESLTRSSSRRGSVTEPAVAHPPAPAPVPVPRSAAAPSLGVAFAPYSTAPLPSSSSAAASIAARASSPLPPRAPSPAPVARVSPPLVRIHPAYRIPIATAPTSPPARAAVSAPSSFALPSTSGAASASHVDGTRSSTSWTPTREDVISSAAAAAQRRLLASSSSAGGKLSPPGAAAGSRSPPAYVTRGGLAGGVGPAAPLMRAPSPVPIPRLPLGSSFGSAASASSRRDEPSSSRWLAGVEPIPRGTADKDFFALVRPRVEALLRASSPAPASPPHPSASASSSPASARPPSARTASPSPPRSVTFSPTYRSATTGLGAGAGAARVSSASRARAPSSPGGVPPELIESMRRVLADHKGEVAASAGGSPASYLRSAPPSPPTLAPPAAAGGLSSPWARREAELSLEAALLSAGNFMRVPAASSHRTNPLLAGFNV
jgi:hypothetical protein